MSLTSLPTDHLLAWAIIILAMLGVIARPLHWPEAIWAVAGAALLVLLRLLPVSDALAGMRKGVDVYLFLAGMMLIAELARREGFFDWLAALAVEHAHGSPQRLFLLVYGVGTLVTAFLSNDATAIVLTPAVYAATPRRGCDPCPTCSSAPSLPTPRASCCRSPIPPISWSMARACRISATGSGSSRCRLLPPSPSPVSCCAWRCAARSTRRTSRATCRDRASASVAS
jgi:hypothetical protein